MKKLLVWFVILCIVFSCTGCQAAPHSDIVATTLPVYDFCRLLCQDTPITISRLISEPVSCLHDYSLQVRQMQLLQGAKMVLISGAGMESFMEDALEIADHVIDCSSGVSLLCSEEHDHDHHETHDPHDHGAYDPHYWLDPENAMIMAENICQALTSEYPEYEDVFRRNLDTLLKDLNTLNQYAKEQLSGLSCTELITFHDGFSYLANAYDLSILEAVEEEAGSETSASKLVEIITAVNTHHLRAIFTETNGSTASALVISAETGVRIYTLDMVISGQSYLEAMYQNINTLKEALE